MIDSLIPFKIQMIFCDLLIIVLMSIFVFMIVGAFVCEIWMGVTGRDPGKEKPMAKKSLAKIREENERLKHQLLLALENLERTAQEKQNALSIIGNLQKRLKSNCPGAGE